VVDAFAMETQELGPTYVGDFEFESSFTGNGFVTYGYAEEELSAIATATPESIDPVAPGDPLLNADTALFDGDVEVFFSDTGVVTGPSTGAPVALEVTVASSGVGLFFGCNGSFERTANTTSDVEVIDNSAGFVGVEFFFFGPDTQTLTLNTAVGHVLAINGRFRVFAQGTAGRGNGFVETCSAQAANTSYVTFSLPQGFGVEAESGHDYTTTAPEPGQALLALTGALALAVARIGRR
jgi:hypothetical protein